MQRIIIKNKKTNSKKAFFLIEALVAISILMVGILGAFILVVRTLASTPVVQARLVAANLSQEGIELVRKIRDTNFINADDFRVGLENGSWQTDWYSNGLDRYNQNDVLNFDIDDGIYHYGGIKGEPYFFRREIKISDIVNPTTNVVDPNIMKVNVIMY